MEAKEQHNQIENDEYVLLDLDSVCMPADIPANAPYILSGLDTLNPRLSIGNRLKLIGEYQETIGTCYMFSETDDEKIVKSSETGPAGGDNQVPSKQIRHVATAYKVLKFKQETD